MKYRHEYKYIISKNDALILKERVGAILKPDIHGKEGYEVRSIYFDDVNDSCYMQNIDGVDGRAKYRIRAYDGSDKFLVLEKKIKKNGMTAKLSEEISLKEMELLLSDRITPVFLSKDNGTAVRAGAKGNRSATVDVLNELLLLKESAFFRPKVLVSYVRYPYIEECGNVRITFDDGITSSADYGAFFDEHIHSRPVLKENETLMEVKFDEFLPEYIKEALECGSLEQTTFSKYALCRRFHL